MFDVKYVCGEQKDEFLKYLDEHIIKLNKKAKIMFGAVVGLSLTHFCIKYGPRIMAATSNQNSDKIKNKWYLH